MKQLLSLLCLPLLLVMICPTQTSSQSASDEETLKKLEIEGAKHAGTSDADIAFGKKVNSEHVVSVDPLGHVSDQTPADMEKMTLGIRKADPDIKASVEIQDIKVRISGDTAIVTYSGTYNATGHKDARYDVPNAKFVAVDTWQKQSGKWKILAQTFVATDQFLAKYISSHLRRVCNSTYLTTSQPRSFQPGTAHNRLTRRRALADVPERLVQKAREQIVVELPQACLTLEWTARARQ